MARVRPTSAEVRKLPVDGTIQKVLCPAEGTAWLLVRTLATVGRNIGKVKLVHPVRVLDDGTCVSAAGAARFALKIWSKAAVAAATLTSPDDPYEEIIIMDFLQRAAGGHPHLMPLHAIYESPGELFALMAYCEGGDLFSRMERGALSEPLARHLFGQLLSAVERMHELGVAHGDISLENAMLTAAGQEQCGGSGGGGARPSQVILMVCGALLPPVHLTQHTSFSLQLLGSLTRCPPSSRTLA